MTLLASVTTDYVVLCLLELDVNGLRMGPYRECSLVAGFFGPHAVCETRHCSAAVSATSTL